MIHVLLLLGLSAPDLRPPAPDPLEIRSWFSPQSYPARALQEGAEGTVAFEVQVDARGRPGRCVVTSSSGHRSLDEGTCDIIRRRGRFRAAVGRDGSPVASTFASQVSWRTAVPAPHSYRAVIVDLSAEGAPSQCRVEAMEMLPDEADSCAAALRDIALQPNVARSFSRLTFLLMHSDNEILPFPPDPSWGRRLSRLVSEQIRLGAAPFPITCTTVVAEGWSEGTDACGGFPHRRRRLTRAEAAHAQVGRLEMSVFGVPRE
jgi:TonB family protein